MAKASGSIDLKPVKAAHDDATKYITKIDDAGITVHPYNDTTGAVVTKDRAVITSGGMEIYKDDNSVAFFGETARIGKASGASRVLIDFNSFRQVDKEGFAYVKFADLRDARGIATINDDVLEARYFGQGDRMYVGNALIYELLSLTADGDDVLADATIVDGRVQIDPLPAIDAVVIASYTTKDRMMKAFTFGDRATSEIGVLSFSTGTSNTATGYAAHAEGSFNGANGECAHSEGRSTMASDDCAHSEGRSTTASGAQSHAEGRFTTAGGWASHAGGSHTIARRYAQTAIGEYNVEETGNGTYRGNYVVIIGNGEDEENRSNALTIDWNGGVIGQAMAGMIQMFAGSTAPTGWLICDGQAVSRTTYATLFSVIGTTYGSGDGSTTFNLPDMRGRTAIGVGNGTATNHTNHTLAEQGGRENAIVPYHRHTTTAGGDEFSSGSGSESAYMKTSNRSLTTKYTSYAGSEGNATGANMQPYLTLNYIICTGKTS